MPDWKSVIAFINIQSIILAMLMALGQLFSSGNRIKRLLFVDLFIIFALIQGHMALFVSGLVKNYPLLQQMIIPALFAFGPIMYFFARLALQEEYQLSPLHFLHYLPSLLSFAASLAILPLTEPAPLGIYTHFFYNHYTMMLGFFGGISYVIYLFLILRIFRKKNLLNVRAWQYNPETTIFIILYGLLLFAIVCDLFSTILQSLILLEIVMLILTASVLILFFVNFKYPHFYLAVQETARKETVKRSYLKNVNINELEKRLSTIMTEEKIFINEDLSLNLLAKHCEITPHQLSQYINTYKDTNFNGFINQYRIDEAKRLLEEKPDSSILEIAFEVGFKSKSAFNSAFVKITSNTPKKFRSKFSQ